MIDQRTSQKKPGAAVISILLAALLVGACSVKPAQMNITGFDQPLGMESILDSATGRIIDFAALMDQLERVRVVYVGERHTAMRHHQIQLQIIQALVERGHQVRVGMEMFAHTYQRRLDRWSAGEMSWDEFLKQVHWYATWRFDDELYKDILLFVQERHLPLIGLNIPFYLPRKISVGGLDRLLDSERAFLPAEIDLSQPEHRAYVEEIFQAHHIRGKDDFEDFYAAQCAWEDGMADQVSRHSGDRGIMVVLAGNGHIVRKFGIPQRAYKRNGAEYRTVYLAAPGMEVDRRDGDFIWVAAPMPAHKTNGKPKPME